MNGFDIEIEKISDDVKEMLMRHTNWSTDQEDEWVSAGINCDILMDTLGTCAQHHNTELIPDDMFDQSYVEEMLHDQGQKIPDWVVVDWEQTVDNVRQDYTSVTLDDVTYWTNGC
mgnify:CR=1 FL=1